MQVANEGTLRGALITFLAHDMKVFKNGQVTVHVVKSSLVNELVKLLRYMDSHRKFGAATIDQSKDNY